MPKTEKYPWQLNAKGEWSRWLPDGSRIVIGNRGSWDLTLPSGKHKHGQTTGTESAKAQSMEAYTQHVMLRWMEGDLLAGGRFQVSLT